MIESEYIKKQKTRNSIPGFYYIFPIIMNVLLKLPYTRGNLCKSTDKEMLLIQDLFQFYIYDIAFKIRNIVVLMEIGSYADATILFRTLVENFIIYKYFIKKKDGIGLSNYYERNTSKSIKDIFEAEIPGYYDDIYSGLCKASHGDPLLQGIFRGNMSKDKPLKTNINNINVNFFSYIVNQLFPIIIGVIELYKLVYPQNILESSKQEKEQVDIIYKFINDDIEDRKKQFPLQFKLIEYYNKISRFDMF